MTCWSGLLLLVGLGVYGINQMLGMEYGHTGEICRDANLAYVICAICVAALGIDMLNWLKEKKDASL